ncbi:hypothetical protein MKZ38_002705 [Zalerion maritima]|uniref:Rhodanese domain-containing protein n=1 Tax=Zalerion maritima TaxID=339359 RepID=A0AAD5RPV1_9PEZI|nr:hypothetical protein MKZ38_002705 [Zalerion maritima]
MRLPTLLVTIVPLALCSPSQPIMGPIVTPSWVDSHLDSSNVVVVDLRTADEYMAGHIPGSTSIPFDTVSAWSIMGESELLLEMPDTDDLYPVLETSGISTPWPMTKVVLVYGVGDTAYPLAAGPRVAVTLKYAGISTGRVSVLDGGYPGWVSAGYNTTTDVLANATEANFCGPKDDDFLVKMDYVHERLDSENVIMFDGRDTAVYNGSVLEAWAEKAGHIPGAYSLPAVNIWNEDGSYKSETELMTQVYESAGGPVSKWSREIIVYCGVGGYASSWYFVLTRVLGFNNVKMYDGSAQEWSLYYDMEV